MLSPLSGIILSLNVQRGQLISSGTASFSQEAPLSVIGDLFQLQVRAEVDETDGWEEGSKRSAHSNKF